MRLIVPWGEAEGFLRDERAMMLATDVSDADCEGAEYEAAEMVFDAYRTLGRVDPGYGWRERGTVRVPELDAVASSLGLDAESLRDEPFAFIDRFGEYVGTWTVALRLARRIATTHPDHVLDALVAYERRMEDSVTQADPLDTLPPEWHAARLRESQPMFDLVREWCGREAATRFDELEALRGEIAHLRVVIERAAKELEWAGHRHAARKLRRECDLA